MNFPKQCRRRIKGVRCENEHITGHYFCNRCIDEVEKGISQRVYKCRRETKKGFCQNEKMDNGRFCAECQYEIDTRRRYFVHRINKDLILDLAI